MTDRVLLENTRIWVHCHDKNKCYDDICSLHNRTPHHMRDWPQNWREDRTIMERICSHGIGHPDPDDFKIVRFLDKGEHGCDGCCRLL